MYVVKRVGGNADSCLFIPYGKTLEPLHIYTVHKNRKGYFLGGGLLS